MKTKKADRRASTGLTIAEMMIAVAILGIISAGIAALLTGFQRNYSVEDARIGIKTGTQTAVNKIALNLTATKRIFQNNAGDNAFLALAQISAPAPGALAGSLLPQINDGASMSPNSGAFVASAVGNSLFFASLDLPFVTVPTILDSSSNPNTIRVDSYHFNYYYLSQSASTSVGGQGQIMLWEWHSVSFADYPQITAWTDATLQSNLVKSLVAAGYTYAWDPGQNAANSAFYQLGVVGGVGTITALVTAPALTQKTAAPMIKLLTGSLGAGYSYGVAQNTGAAFTIPYAVPQFGTANGKFPSGFEIVVVGSSSARQVLMHLVLAAQGAFKGLIANEQVVVATARDIH
jgi:hypothetical protein